MTKSRWRFLLHSRFFSPKGFLLRAIWLLILLLIVHLLGWRNSMTILCGTSPTGREIDYFTAFCGAAYGSLFFVCVGIVPGIVIGAGFFFLFLKWTPRKAHGNAQ